MIALVWNSRLTLAAITALALSGCADMATEASSDTPVNARAVVAHYADIAHSEYQDALISARKLNQATDALIANPSRKTMTEARQAWLAARIPYQQTEVFRFGNTVVDDWEGQVNAWPLDEGLIDYVASDGYQHELGNGGATANIIANTRINVGGTRLDVSRLTPELLANLNEIGGSEANVATGYHAIEFLLWGQDLNGFAAGNGNRPASDYLQTSQCTHGNCDRRAAYLDAVTDLLVADLAWMVDQWAPGQTDNYRAELTALAPSEAVQKILFGMGSLSLGEMAGDRMKVALEANSPEDEHDCFSDNTHNSHFYDGQGIVNVYTGTYIRLDGSRVTGPAVSGLLRQTDPALANLLRKQLTHTMATLTNMKQRAETGDHPMTFDMMIAPGNQEGARVIRQVIESLVAQTELIEKAATTLKTGAAEAQGTDKGSTRAPQ